MISHQATATTSEARQPQYRVVLADDHQDILDGLYNLLASHFQVLAAVKDGNALIEAVARTRPDAVISDIYMPGRNGIEAGAHILRTGLCKAFIILTMHNESNLVRKVLEEGIHGYVLKEDAADELIPAVHAVLEGDYYLSRGVAANADGPRA